MPSKSKKRPPHMTRPEPLRLRSSAKIGIKASERPMFSPSKSNSIPSSELSDPEKLEEELPPADGGAAAWKFLFAASTFEAFMFGLPLNYGVFENYYFQQEPFRGNKNLASVGTLGTCFFFLGAPLATPIVKRYRRWHREIIWAGWLIAISGVAFASFARDITSLVATQGLVYGVGLLIMYYPIISMINEWWVVRRGLAMGIFCSATGVSGLGMPFVLEALLSRYGWQTTLRVTALFLICACGPLMPFFKNRHPVDHHAEIAHTDWAFFKMPAFYALSFATLFQGLGMYFPLLFLPTYANSLGLSPTMGASLLAVPSLSQIIGQVGFGYLSDFHVKWLFIDRRMSVHLLVFISSFMSSICIFALWGLAQSLTMLVAFAFMFGIFGGGYVALWARMSTALTDDPVTALSIFSIQAAMRGVGNVLVGPTSSALITPDVLLGQYAISKYKGIVIYSGSCMLASASMVVFVGLGRRVFWKVREKGEFCGCPA